ARDAGRGGARRAVRSHRLAVEVELGVELAGAPAEQDLLQRRLVDAEGLLERRQVRSGRDDRADVEILVRPPVEPSADSRRERVVHGRMTRRAGDTDGREVAL